MELNRYAFALLKWWWLLALATGLAAFFSYQNSHNAVPVYRATTTVLVGQFLNSDNPQPQDFAISQQLAQYYAQQVHRQSILQAAATSLDLDRSWASLAGQVNAVAPTGSQLIQISVVDPVPANAKRIADEVAIQLIRHSPTPLDSEQDAQRQFVSGQVSSLQTSIADAQNQIQDLQSQMVTEVSAQQIQDLQAQITVLEDKVTTWQGLYANLLNSLRGSRTNYLSVLDPATVPISPVSSSNMATLLSVAMAFIAAAVAAFLLEYLDDRLRTQDDVRRVLSLPTLGAIPGWGKRSKNGEVPPAVVEAYRLLRTNVQLALGKYDLKLLLVAGVREQEGGSSVAASLAESFARSGKETILVDTNSVQPSVHSTFGGANDSGLTSLLLGDFRRRLDGRTDSADERKGADRRGLRQRLDSSLQATKTEGLRLLTSGPESDSSSDLIDSDEMTRLLEELTTLADMVILDSPPVLAGADAAILAAKGAGVLLVVQSGRTRGRTARLAKETLPSAVQVLGVVLNRAPRAAVARYTALPSKARRGTSVASDRRVMDEHSGISLVDEKATSKGELPSQTAWES